MTESLYQEGLLQDAASTGNGTAVDLQCRTRETTVYASWSSGTSAGVVTVETAEDDGYTGTWASLGTISWSAASKQDVMQITGALRAVRARISTTVTGGTVTVKLFSN